MSNLPEGLYPSLQKAIEEAQWTWAKTYEDTYPHWYVLRQHYPWLYSRMATAIAQYGVDRLFGEESHRYLDIGDCQHWILGCVLNRAPLPQEIYRMSDIVEGPTLPTLMPAAIVKGIDLPPALT